MTSKPYIILLGDVGTGKSTIVEKLTGEIGRSSASDRSVTVSSELFEVFDGSFVICDTPGSNAIDDQFKHNLHIAHAMNFSPVTCVMIVVKADTRMENVIKDVKEYAEGFLPEDLDVELIGVCVTHMDTVGWNKNKLLPLLKGQIGIQTAIFSSNDTTGIILKNDILKECSNRKPQKLSIDGEMFLKLFKISNYNMKIFREARKEVSRFEKMKQDFYQEKEKYGDKIHQMDMIFEFQAWMLEEIIEAQKRLSSNNNFTFIGPKMAGEAGHIANMTNQLRKVLSDVRIEAMKYHKDIDTDFRKCPHCATVWQKIEGCDGATTCGNRVSADKKKDVCSGEYGVMSTFEFIWDLAEEKLIVKMVEERKNIKEKIDTSLKGEFIGNFNLLSNILERNIDGKGAGCGKTIEWSKMAPVSVPVDFNASQCCTKDVKPIPEEKCVTWNESFKEIMKEMEPLNINKSKTNPEKL